MPGVAGGGPVGTVDCGGTIGGRGGVEAGGVEDGGADPFGAFFVGVGTGAGMETGLAMMAWISSTPRGRRAVSSLYPVGVIRTS
ncbi:MAG TPA: hypothetical protein VGG55_01695, partial [Candidatus Acidoferrales bacterium]